MREHWIFPSGQKGVCGGIDEEDICFLTLALLLRHLRHADSVRFCVLTGALEDDGNIGDRLTLEAEPSLTASTSLACSAVDSSSGRRARNLPEPDIRQSPCVSPQQASLVGVAVWIIEESK